MSQIQITQNHNEAQNALSKLEKFPVEEIKATTQNLRRYIPALESCPEEMKEYYREILQGGKNFRDLALKSEVKIDEIQTDLHAVLSQCNSLWNQLEDYKNGYYQQKFDINEYKAELKKIEESTRSLKKIDKELSSMEESLNIINFDGDPINHLGQELTEEDFSRYLEVSNTEKESGQRYEEILTGLKEIDDNINDKELMLKETKKKAEELTEAIAKLNKQLEERDFSIEEREKSISACTEEGEELRVNADNAYASKLSEKMSRDERQREKMEENRSSKNGEFAELMSRLYSQLSQNAAINPLLHLIFVLDQSLSMQGRPWDELMKAMNAYVKQNQSQTADLLSVITFDNTATEVMKKIKFSDYQTPSTQKWGGTNFDGAFRMALDISNLSRTHRPVVIFLTDGDGIMSETPRILREMRELHQDRGFMLFSVGVGQHYNIEALKEITRTANGGNLFLDFGNDRIDFLRTTGDERVLIKFFMEISNALNVLPLKIKAAMETLKKERIEFDKESKRQYDFDKKISEQELKDNSEKQQDLLERRIKVLEIRKAEEKDQIKFFKKQKEDIKKEIEALEDKLQKVSRSVTPSDIENLQREKEIQEEKKVKAWEERDKLSVDRTAIFEVLEKIKSSTKMSTSLQLFDFMKAKERAKALKDNQQVCLGKMRNFLKPIVQESSCVEEGLKVTTGLEEDAIFDIIVEQFRAVLDIENFQDAANFRKIACRLLELKDTDSKGHEALELLMDCLQPRIFVNPNISDEDRKNIINGWIDKKYKFDIASIEAQDERLSDDWKNVTAKLQEAQDDLKKLKKDIEELKEKKPKKEKEVRKLKAKMSKSQKKAEAEADKDKENVKRNSNVDSEDSDEGDDEKLETAMQKLQEIEKKIEGKKSKKTHLKQNIIYLEGQEKILKSQRFEIDSQKSEKGKEKEKMREKVLSYHASLKVELMSKVKKYVKDANFNKIETFEKNLVEKLVKPIGDYLSQQN